MSKPQDHWLVRPSTIRSLSWGSAIVLVLTVASQLLIDVKGFFGMDAWFGFGALFGFGACAVMVGVSRLLGWWLKRSEDYYEAGDD